MTHTPPPTSPQGPTPNWQQPPPPPAPPAWAPQGPPQQFGQHPADPPRMSPPPPPVTELPPAKPHVIGWLVPLAALLAVIGAFTPWFDPTGMYQGQDILDHSSQLYSWKDGKIGLVPPIALVILSITMVSLLRTGRARGRFASGADPVRSSAKAVIFAGAGSIVCVVIAWFLVPGQYHFQTPAGRLSWSDLEDRGVALSRAPQLGYWLTIVAAVLALVAGVAMLVTAKSTKVAPQQFNAPVPQGPQGAPQQNWTQPGAAPYGQQQPQSQQLPQQSPWGPPSLEKQPPPA